MVQYVIIIDTETNSLEVGPLHRMFEIAIAVTDLFSDKRIAEYQTIIKQNKEVWDASHPKAIEVNGFTWDRLQTGKTEDIVKQEIINFYKTNNLNSWNSIVLCQNPKFDYKFFCQLFTPDEQWINRMPRHWFDLASMHFLRALLQMETGKIDKNKIRNLKFSKDSIAEYYNMPPENAEHRAMGGVDHASLIFDRIRKPKRRKINTTNEKNK